MNSSNSTQQRGAALLVALVLLAVITVLAVTNMREVTLEGRMTANRMEMQRLLSATESAQREAEKRFYGPGNVAAKLEPDIENCKKSNTFKRLSNKPCLLTMSADDMQKYLLNPLAYIKGSAALNNWTGAKTDKAEAKDFIPWMPYLGTVVGVTSKLSDNAYWNSLLIPSSGINAEYGDALQGKGTYFYLITAQTADQLAAQTTIANISLGLNN